jgi:hypothetical protein
VDLGREASHVPDRPYDPSGQYGSYAEDLGEGGAGGRVGAGSSYGLFEGLVLSKASTWDVP